MEGDIELFRFELVVKNYDTGLTNVVVVHATSEEEALLTTNKTKEDLVSISKTYAETKSNYS